MTRTLFLHVGMPKTGSSSIQAKLRYFDDGTTRYLDYGSANHSKVALYLFRTTEDLLKVTQYPWFKDATAIDKTRKRIRTLVGREYATHRDVDIFSAEVLYSYSDADFDRALTFFKEVFDTIKVLVYIREPQDFCESSFQQRVKSGWTTIDLATPEYQKNLRKFTSSDRVDEVIARKFNPADLVGGDVVTDALNVFGLPTTPQEKQGRQNTSLSANAVSLVFALNRSDHSDKQTVLGHARADVIKSLSAVPGPKLRLAASVVEAATSKADLDWVQDALGIDLSPPSDPTRAGPVIATDQDLLDLLPEATSWLVDNAADDIQTAVLQALS